jgi:hypothetical protein
LSGDWSAPGGWAEGFCGAGAGGAFGAGALGACASSGPLGQASATQVSNSADAVRARVIR